jgi:energy-coupling factor transporter ATP-binding protein EcfA2
MQTDPVSQPDHETEFIACLLDAAHNTGLCFSEAAFVNFYVALKSKPMVILTGPEGSGKIKAVQCLSRILMGDCAQCQLMVGHPWAFSKSENLAMFTEVHARYTTEKLRWLIEEAWQLKHTQGVHRLPHRISPGSSGFFTRWLRNSGRSPQRLGDIHFSGSILSPNLFDWDHGHAKFRLVGSRPSVKDNDRPMANRGKLVPCFSKQKGPTLGG